MMNIVLITDENYALPTRAAVRSIIQNAAGDEPLVVSVVYDCDQVNVNEAAKFTAISDQVRLVPVTNNHRDKLHSRAHYSHAMYLKYDLPNLFPDLDKILYLDGDMIVSGDLREFYAMDLTGCYAAVVENPLSEDVAKYVRNQLRFTGRYWNSGVILLNLAAMRRDGMPCRLVEYTAAKPWLAMPDQDAFCVILGDRVIFAEPTYNYLIMYRDREIFRRVTNPKIIHYASGHKPWKDVGMFGAQHFLRYLAPDDCSACLPAWLNTINGHSRVVDHRLQVLEQQAHHPWRHLLSTLFYERQPDADGVIRKYKLLGLTLFARQRTPVRKILWLVGFKISWKHKK